MLEIVNFTLGMVETNSYLIADPETRDAVVIDPAWEGEKIARKADEKKWQIRQVWHTHAHFDHIAGTIGIVNSIKPPPELALHSFDLPLWNNQGGAPLFGMVIKTPPEPIILLDDRTELSVGNIHFMVRHTPGHTPGHVVFYAPLEEVVFCGDLIFAGSIGRTDLPGGDFDQLMNSIQKEILMLPDTVRLLSGHGPMTTVGSERRTNPFLID